jgi:hypothetical protein
MPPPDELQALTEDLAKITPEDWLKEVMPPERSGGIYHYTGSDRLRCRI